MNQEFFLHLVRDFIFGDGMDVYVCAKSQDGKISVGGHVELAEVDEFQRIPKTPTFRLSKESVQKVMDRLWDDGYRPSEEHYPRKGELKAVQEHLGDMRNLSTRLLDKVLGAKEADHDDA